MLPKPVFDEMLSGLLELENSGCGREGAAGRLPFDAARRLKGIAARHGIELLKVDAVESVIRQFAARSGRDPARSDELMEQIGYRLPLIVAGEGVDPLRAALTAALSELRAAGDAGLLPGDDWPTARFHKDATLTLGIARRLSCDGQRVFFLPVAKLAAVLETDPPRASRLLAALVRHGYLTVERAHNARRAARYRLG